jgi:ribonuclease HII
MPDFTLENSFRAEGHTHIAGLDEAGRGPLAGPVVAACVIIDPSNSTQSVWQQVQDSKKISEKKREYLFELIQSQSAWGIGSASAQEIDTINILQASFLAMKRAYEQCCQNFDCHAHLLLLDGNQLPKNWPLTPTLKSVVKGDQKSVSIAAASILAKVTRDRFMHALDGQYPYYGFKNNAGYGTADHLKALKIYGACPEHRRSFAPLKSSQEK